MEGCQKIAENETTGRLKKIASPRCSSEYRESEVIPGGGTLEEDGQAIPPSRSSYLIPRQEKKSSEKKGKGGSRNQNIERKRL